VDGFLSSRIRTYHHRPEPKTPNAVNSEGRFMNRPYISTLDGLARHDSVIATGVNRGAISGSTSVVDSAALRSFTCMSEAG